MPYIETNLVSEKDYRELYESIYCNIYNPIFTVDGLWVRFFIEQFDHAFFESQKRKKGDKSVFSRERGKRITWIKDTLEDSSSILKMGWDKEKKRCDNTYRVALAQEDYAVIIKILGNEKAKFVTAYKADNSIKKILANPDWEPLE